MFGVRATKFCPTHLSGLPIRLLLAWLARSTAPLPIPIRCLSKVAIVSLSAPHDFLAGRRDQLTERVLVHGRAESATPSYLNEQRYSVLSAAHNPEPCRYGLCRYVYLLMPGNRAATFPCQLLGWDVDAVNTVQFSNHTGYGRWGGLRFDAAHLADVFSNMDRNKLLRHNRQLTGYTPSPEALGEVEKLIRAQREKNPHMVYLLDPVMGDMDRGMYVNPDVLPIYRRMLHLASIICPNQFEAQVLSGIEIRSIETLKAALTKLHDEYQVPHVLITSLELSKDDLNAIGAMPSMPDGKPAMLLVGSTWNADTKELQPWFLQFPSLGEYFSGVGDLFSALTVARFMEYEEDVPAPARAAYDGYGAPVEGECTLPIARAVTLAVASLQQVLIRTARAMEILGEQEGLDPLQPSHLASEEDRVKIMRMRELRIIQSADDILRPQVLYRPRWTAPLASTASST